MGSSRSFVAGRTRDAIGGRPLGQRAEAAWMPVVVPDFGAELADPGSQWVSRKAFAAWPARDRWVAAAVEALRSRPPPPIVAIDRLEDAVQVRYAAPPDRWYVLDVRHLFELEGSTVELAAFRDRVAGDGGAATVGGFTVELVRIGEGGRITTRQRGELVEQLDVPWTRVKSWARLTTPPGPIAP
ncbi:MAG: hypothetical protein AAF602_26905 [Myxococcota bacterium]